MISFDNFILEDGMPIYIQILMYIKRGIIKGIINDKDELPSRRMLSALLGVNPNTVQKAYKILEEENLIQSHSGAKSYMELDEEKISKIRHEVVESDIKSMINSAVQMGLSKNEVIELIEKFWKLGE